MYNNCPVNINPYALPDIVKTPNIINLNYTNQDFWSMKTRLIKFIRERFGPQGTEIPNTFNDFVESSIAIMLIENWAFLADTLSFKMDQIVNELFIDTVTEVENAFRLARLIGFRPQPPIAATSMWTATVTAQRVADVVIPTPYRVNLAVGGAPLTIELFAADANGEPIFGSPIIIPPEQVTNSNVIGLEGMTIEDVFTGNGDPSQVYTLTSTPVLYGSVSVMVDGIRWQEVEYFTDSQPRREYRFEQNSEYTGFVIFGNNRAGIIPPTGSRISVTYRTGGGQRGNIVTNYGSASTTADVEGLNYGVPVTFANYTRGKGGYDGDTIEDIRRKLPAWVRLQDRCVSGSDYKVFADQFATAYHGQIGKANAVLRNHGCAGNVVDLYVLAKENERDLELAPSGLKVALNEAMTTRKMLTDFLCIRDGTVILVDVSIEVTLDKFYRKFQEEIRQRILDKTNGFFSLNNWEYGETLRSIDLVRELADIKQANGIDISFTTVDPENSGETVVSKYYEIIRPDQIDVSFTYA